MKRNKTIKAAAEQSGISPRLINAVIRQLGGRDSLRDVANHGADAGYPGFTYKADTVAFFRRHRATINALVERMADDLGELAIDMVRGFRCLGNDYTQAEIARAMYGNGGESCDTTQNALAWFALEEVARAFEVEQ